MNRTRVVVPTADLTAPHFDDEATIVRARPVVPIARAKAAARSRMSALILIGLMAAAVSGAAGAFGVNYYKHHSRALASTAAPQISHEPQTNQPPASEPQSVTPAPALKGPNAQGAVDASVSAESASPEAESSNPDDSLKDRKVASASNAGADRSQPASPKPARSAKPDYKTSRASYDPARMVRPRRVHPIRTVNQRPANKRNGGAGRIPEIFEGPNPR